MAAPRNLTGASLAREIRAGGGNGDRRIAVHGSIDSTSSELKRMCAEGACGGTVVAALRQTTGRGRQGNNWHSPGLGNLYLSLAVDIPGDFRSILTLVPLAAGVAAMEALEAAGFDRAKLKWPNDILVDGAKLGGILCEVVDLGATPVVAVVGIGMNTGEGRFPDEIKGRAVSMSQLPDTIVEPVVFAGRWIAALEDWCRRLGGSKAGKIELVRAWTARSEPFGRRVRVGDVTGTTVNLNESGRLVIQQDDGTRVQIPGGMVEDL